MSEPTPGFRNRLREQLALERIVCAACWADTGEASKYLPDNIDSGIVFPGLRHCDCIGLANITMGIEWRRGLANKGRWHEGFLTSTGRFVDRQEAADIAFTAGQIAEVRRMGLDSADLY